MNAEKQPYSIIYTKREGWKQEEEDRKVKQTERIEIYQTDGVKE